MPLHCMPPAAAGPVTEHPWSRYPAGQNRHTNVYFGKCNLLLARHTSFREAKPPQKEVCPRFLKCADPFMPLSAFSTIFGHFRSFLDIVGHFRPIFGTTLAHFRPVSVIFCTFSAHFRAIFSHLGHFLSIYDPFSTISVIVWSLSAIIIIGNFWPCVAHFAAHLCQFSTSLFYVQLRPKCDQFRPF